MEGPSLLEGLQICSVCAARSRVRLHRALAIAGLMFAMSLAPAVVLAAQSDEYWWVALLASVLEYGAIFGGALAWMKRANRRRFAQLGTGEVWPEPSMSPKADTILHRSTKPRG